MSFTKKWRLADQDRRASERRNRFARCRDQRVVGKMKAVIDEEAHRKRDFDVRTGRQGDRYKFLGVTLQFVQPEPFGSLFGNGRVVRRLPLKELDIPLYHFSL
jgi:hypothetical protein